MPSSGFLVGEKIQLLSTTQCVPEARSPSGAGRHALLGSHSGGSGWVSECSLGLKSLNQQAHHYKRENHPLDHEGALSYHDTLCPSVLKPLSMRLTVLGEVWVTWRVVCSQEEDVDKCANLGRGKTPSFVGEKCMRHRSVSVAQVKPPRSVSCLHKRILEGCLGSGI